MDIHSQDTAVRTLRRSLASGKTAHAYLFAGPPGVGKHLTARVLSAALNCEEMGDDACGECISCRKIKKDVHPDVFKIGPLPNKKNIPVDSIRELQKRLLLRPHEGRSKVVIVEPADMMTEPAANALLKTLEEPGSGRFLVLVTSRVSYMLPTVRSRCQIIRFSALPEAVVEKLLLDAGASPEKASAAAALSGGSMTRAISYLEEDIEGCVEKILLFLSCAAERTPLSGMQIVEELKKAKGGAREEALNFIQLAPAVLSEILHIAMHKDDDGASRPLTRICKDRLVSLAGRFSAERIAAFVFAFHHAEQAVLNNNMNPQLALEGVLMSMRSSSVQMGAGSGFKRI